MSNGARTGCFCAKGGASLKEFGPMFFASGGFVAAFTYNSFLALYRSDLLRFLITNGERCTGDAIKMSEAVCDKSIELEWV